MRFIASIVFGLSVFTSAALAQNSFKALNCATADMTASPYTVFQIERKGGGKVSLAYHTTAFLGSEEFSKPVFDEYLGSGASDTVSSQPETKTSAGGFYIEWGDGDAAYLDITRAKTKKGGKIFKAKNYTGSIHFPNGQGPSHLHDGGSVKVTCSVAGWPWDRSNR